MTDSVVSDSTACMHAAGSLGRLQTYRRRVERGQPIFNPADKQAVLKSLDVAQSKADYIRSLKDPVSDER